ncbi:PAS domain S-box protein [Desulfopila sp. IMCC35008]|uniref:PAS domain S-box protein n=1 Tax=Desulfopila sp. IMCC35008 TaxID=2653858 RepID=UPI0013D10217|nr:PAS domain S-box protein [Desulfopila sp. IMCC35008]
MRKVFSGHYLPIAILGLCGYFGNILDLPISFGVSFIFGSICSVIAVAYFGIGPGLVVSLIASSYTYHLWNHPYAIIIFFLEILWIGWFLRRGKSNFLLIDLSFWLLVGSPLVFVCYGALMGLGFQNVLLIALKQSINGTLNTLLAWIILSLPLVFTRPIGPFTKRHITSEHVIFQFAGMFLLTSSLLMLLLYTQRELRNSHEDVTHSLQSDSEAAASNLSEWIDKHVVAIQVVNEIVTGDRNLVSTASFQEQLTRIRSLYPDFNDIYIGDNTAPTITLRPLINDDGEAILDFDVEDEIWFKELESNKGPVVSDVFFDRWGISVPFFIVSTPPGRTDKFSYFVSGIINLNKLLKVMSLQGSEHGRIFNLVDRNQKVLVSTSHKSEQLFEANSFADARQIPVGNNVILVVPGVKRNISIMQAYKDAYYLIRMPISGTPWYLNVAHPVAPLQNEYHHNAIQGLACILGLLIIMTSAISLLSRWLTAALQKLARVTVNLPQKIEKQERVTWPSSRLEDVSKLIQNFQLSAESLAKSFEKNHKVNISLEEAVANRTQELQEERQRLAEVLKENTIILENTTVGITMVRQRKQVWQNSAALELFGYSDEEVKNLSTLNFYRSQEEYEKIGAEAYPVLKRGEAYHTETTLRRADGSDMEVSLHGQAVNPECPQDGSIWIIEDISDRKHLEKEREKLILELQTALMEVKTLGSMLPICSSCKKIRDDEGYWKQIEEYLGEHTGAEFSHGICNDCIEKLYGNEEWYRKSNNSS